MAQAQTVQIQTTGIELSTVVLGPGLPLFPGVARSYVGTVTQISATGQPVTGTFALYVRTDGALGGKMVINGVTTEYSGKVTSGKTTRGTAFIREPRPYTIVDGKPVYGPKTPKIPLFASASAVYGGSLDKDGNGLLFHAELGAYPDPIVLPANISGEYQIVPPADAAEE